MYRQQQWENHAKETGDTFYSQNNNMYAQHHMPVPQPLVFQPHPQTVRSNARLHTASPEELIGNARLVDDRDLGAYTTPSIGHSRCSTTSPRPSTRETDIQSNASRSFRMSRTVLKVPDEYGAVAVADSHAVGGEDYDCDEVDDVAEESQDEGSPRRKRTRCAQACEPCRRRKVKCKNGVPCDRCKRLKKNCVFSESPTALHRLANARARAGLDANILKQFPSAAHPNVSMRPVPTSKTTSSSTAQPKRTPRPALKTLKLTPISPVSQNGDRVTPVVHIQARPSSANAALSAITSAVTVNTDGFVTPWDSRAGQANGMDHVESTMMPWTAMPAEPSPMFAPYASSSSLQSLTDSTYTIAPPAVSQLGDHLVYGTPQFNWASVPAICDSSLYGREVIPGPPLFANYTLGSPYSNLTTSFPLTIASGVSRSTATSRSASGTGTSFSTSDELPSPLTSTCYPPPLAPEASFQSGYLTPQSAHQIPFEITTPTLGTQIGYFDAKNANLAWEYGQDSMPGSALGLDLGAVWVLDHGTTASEQVMLSGSEIVE